MVGLGRERRNGAELEIRVVQAQAWDVDVGADNHLYVIDGGDLKPKPLRPIHPDRPVLRRLTLEGEVVDAWGSFGTEAGRLDVGHAIAVGADGAVYSGEALAWVRVQKFIKQ